MLPELRGFDRQSHGAVLLLYWRFVTQTRVTNKITLLAPICLWSTSEVGRTGCRTTTTTYHCNNLVGYPCTPDGQLLAQVNLWCIVYHVTRPPVLTHRHDKHAPHGIVLDG